MNLVDHTIISSFEIRYLERLAKKENIPRLAVITETAINQELLDVMKTINAYSWHPWYKRVTAEQVTQAHKHGLKVFPFTVNTIKDFEYLIGIGVDGVFTDHVQLLRSR